MQSRKKATIYDIAQYACTSTATVSRVLSNSGYPVKEDIKAKILDAAQKLNYSPNIVGRMLKKNRSMDIGVIIPTISNPFYTQLILGIETEAQKRGYNILLCNSFRDSKMEKNYLESLYQKQVKGIILSSIGSNHSILEEMKSNGVSIVAFDQVIENIKCSKVGFDYIKGGMMALEYLIGHGHKKIAFLTSPITRKSRIDVLDGYKMALLKNGLSYDKNLVLVSECEEEFENATYEFENGKQLARKFLNLLVRPSAIFAINDMTAFGIMQELIANGINIPEDVSIIGFDDIEFSTMTTPPLTTINQPSFETGKLACKILIENMSQDDENNISILLEPSIVERKSVKNLEM